MIPETRMLIWAFERTHIVWGDQMMLEMKCQFRSIDGLRCVRVLHQPFMDQVLAMNDAYCFCSGAAMFQISLKLQRNSLYCSWLRAFRYFLWFINFVYIFSDKKTKPKFVYSIFSLSTFISTTLLALFELLCVGGAKTETYINIMILITSMIIVEMKLTWHYSIEIQRYRHIFMILFFFSIRPFI